MKWGLETPHISYLYDCQPLKCASNSNIIAQVVDNAVRNLGINRSFFCLLMSDILVTSAHYWKNKMKWSLETPHVSYLYDCQHLKCAPNSNIIAQVVYDAARNLGINRSFFCLLPSDAVKYMIAAGITLKFLSQDRDVHIYWTIVLWKSNFTLKMWIS